MKLTPEIIQELECVLDARKKSGEVIWEDGTELEVSLAGTFVGDKFIVIKPRKEKETCVANPNLKRHHE